MARTKINVTALSADTAANAIAGGVFQAGDVANGNYLSGSEIGKAGTLVLYVKNGDAAPQTVTVLEGVGGHLGLGWRAGLGDLVITAAAATGEQICHITDTARFKQADGTIHIDVSDADTDVAAFILS